MIYAICNPTSGHGRGRKVGSQIEMILKEKNIPCRMVYTAHPGHATELAREAGREGAELVLSIGGDGTSFEVAQGLLGTEMPLGIIPAGTGNDFVKAIGIPAKPAQALEHILSHPAVRTDVGMLNDRMFLNEIGTGFDVMVLDYTQRVKRFARGMLPYFYGVLQTLFRFRSVDLTYAIDQGDEITQKAFIVTVANGSRFGGGITIAPDAKVDDGLFDVIVVGDIRKRDLPKRLIGLMRGKILSFPETRFQRARSITFSVPNMRIDVDGEIIPAKQADVRILPGALLIHR